MRGVNTTKMELGAVVTSKDKEYNVNKLLIFLASNFDAPFYVKRKVYMVYTDRLSGY